MKIALMAPAGAMHRYNGSFSKALHYAPLTLTTLAALVPPELNATIEIYDETVDYLPRETDADVIGMTVITGTSQRSYRWADYYRRKGITVVLGGPHVSLLPHEAKDHADAVVVGYAEQSWPQLLRDLKNGSLRPYYYPGPHFTLAGRPPPRRELLKAERYITTNSVETSRGCVHSCRFCVTPAMTGQNLVTRPVPEVIAEVERLPGREVVFVDVNLIAHPGHAKELFRELIPLKKRWFGLVTVNIGRNRELFDLMVKSGCKGVLIGFEAFSSPSLKSIDKGFNRVEEYEDLVRRLHDAGIIINGTFVLGTDGDDKSVFARTYEMIQRLKIDLPRFSVMTPFPGTPLYRSLEAQGRIIDRNWANYDVEHCVIRPQHMTPRELEDGLDWTWNQTYALSSIWNRIAGINSRLPLNVPVNLGYRRYAKRLADFPKQIMMDMSDIPAYEEDHLYLPSHR
ncbi:MAG: B12-binding domain-containing radical SAM protein [Candidatus Omnitrophica bacterium]|nr:B12-binding domain-containing radical SAM protein [Candidatus Omnitrophota bacterium]